MKNRDKASQPLRVAIAGFGTVGSAAARLIRNQSEQFARLLGAPLKLAAVLVRNRDRKDLSWLGDEVRVVESMEDFFAVGADVVVELIGGDDPAEKIILRALKEGKAVVTANKMLLARSGARYLELARRHKTFLGFEATVAGGIPILRSLRRSLFSDRIVSVRGILNGTCNFILTEMAESGRRFQDVLSEAQARGYAEADPYMDVSGRDTADKLAILTAFAFGGWVKPEEIPTRGIADLHPIDFEYARKLDGVIRMLGSAHVEDGKTFMRVGPFLVDRKLPLANISGVLNAVEVTGQRLGSALFSGRGAGGDPTAVSVAADILNAALWLRGKSAPDTEFFGGAATVSTESALNRSQEDRYPFYLRFFVQDKPGIIAAIAAILAREEINIDAVFQGSWPDRSDLPFVISVDPTPYPTMRRALEAISKLDFNRVPPLALPVLG